MTTIPVIVDAKAAWYNTKVVFVKDQMYTITANGYVYPWSGANAYSPNGDSSTQWQYSLSPSNNFCMLIGRIGPNGTPFPVGATYGPKAATVTGELYLAVNDGVNFSDNSGQFNASITVPACVPLSPLSGAVQVKADRIDAELMAAWGVMLTVECSAADSVRWTSTQKQNLVNAFVDINTRLTHRTNCNFKAVFGGIEFRHVTSLIPNDIGALTPSAQKGFLVQVGPCGRGCGVPRTVNRAFGETNTGAYGLDIPGDAGIKATVTHELGHALIYRTRPLAGQLDRSIYAAGLQYHLPSVKGDSDTTDIGRVWENSIGQLDENVADNFLNWVFGYSNGYRITDPDVYNNAPCNNDATCDNAHRISAFWLGNITFTEGADIVRGQTVGIQGWSDLANAQATIGLQALGG